MFSKVRFVVLFVIAIAIVGCNNQFISSGIIYMQQSDFDKAIVQFNEAVKIEPNNAQAYLWLGKAYGSKQEYDNAAKYFVLALDKDSVGSVIKEMKDAQEFYWPVLFNAGTGFLKNKDAKERKSDYESWLNKAEIVKDTSVNYDYLVLLYAESEDEANMLKTIEKAFAKNPSNVALYFNTAKYYISKEKFDDAKKYLEKAIAIDSKNPQIIYWLGEISYSSNKVEDALTTFKKFFDVISALDSTSAKKYTSYVQDAAFKTGKINLETKKNYNDAIKYFSMALNENADDFESMLNLGFAYYKNKKYSEAIKTLDDYMTKTGVSVSDLFLIQSDCYNRLGKTKESTEMYKKYEELKKQGK